MRRIVEGSARMVTSLIETRFFTFYLDDVLLLGSGDINVLYAKL